MFIQKVISKKFEKKNKFCRPKSHWRQEQDPDPLDRGTDPRIRIRTKILRIQNTMTMTVPD